MWPAAEVVLLFVALYPVCTAALCTLEGSSFGARGVEGVRGAWRAGPVSVLIPAYNEASVIATSVRAALAVTIRCTRCSSSTTARPTTPSGRPAAGGEVTPGALIRDPVNLGKADRLNAGLVEARHDLVAVIDADTHVHPAAVKLLVARMSRSPMVAAVAGSPHVTNRGRVLLAMQVLEAGSSSG